MTQCDMMRNFGVIYMNSYEYAYFFLLEHTKRVQPIILLDKKLGMVFSLKVRIVLPPVRVCWG